MKQTPSQTVGPYLATGLTPEQYGYDFKELVGSEMVNSLEHKDAITITGKVLDGKGEMVPNAIGRTLAERWQKSIVWQMWYRYKQRRKVFVHHC